jgi:hypothetical protein
VEAFKNLLAALNAEQRGSESVCKCPAHDDSNPSLWLKESNGKILLHCFSGCSQSSVIDALRARGLWSDAEAATRSLPPGIPYFWPPAAVLKAAGKEPSPDNTKSYVAHYPYHAASGEIIGHVVRYEGHGKKDLIPFFKRSGGQWRSGLGMKSGRPLFNLHRLDEHTRLIVVVEGEKCASLLQDYLDRTNWSACVITWPSGASAAGKADWSPVIKVLNDYHEAEIIIWPDKDTPGAAAAKKLVEIIHGQCSSPVSVIDVEQFEGEAEGFDCADWLPGKTYEDFKALKKLVALPDKKKTGNQQNEN